MTDLAIVVPVLRRPQAAAKFMASLNAATDNPPIVYAVTDPSDSATRKAWMAAGAVVMSSTLGARFAQKVEYAYLNTDQAWLLLVGDDVDFYDNWDDQVRVLMKKRSAGLIATNDMHNPFVLTGQHATHPVIRRSWVDENGASWDGPGHIAHRGYHHAFVDAEWTARAMEDDVFVFASEAKIEHLHPTWGTGKRDGIYRLGMTRYNEDAALFAARQKEFGR